MKSIDRVECLRLALRLVQLDDAVYIHALRTDPVYNTHLSVVTGTADDQRAWLERYKEREAAGEEYYYIVERSDDGSECGVVRLYDIGDDRFSWGSWILDENKPRKAALECAVLSLGIGFESLRKKTALLDVRRRNNGALSFYRRFGMVETGRDDLNIYLEYSRDKFLADRPGHLCVLKYGVKT